MKLNISVLLPVKLQQGWGTVLTCQVEDFLKWPCDVFVEEHTQV